MNWKEFKKNIGARLRLHPLSKIKRDDSIIDWEDYDWIVNRIDDEDKTVHLSSVGPGYSIVLGKDHIYSYMQETLRPDDGLRYGILRLHVQLIVDGYNIKMEPIAHA